MLKIVEEVTTVYRVLDAADRLIRELPTLIEAEAFKLGFEEATPAYEPEEFDTEERDAFEGYLEKMMPPESPEQLAQDINEVVDDVVVAEVTALDAEVFEDTEPLVTNGSAETIEV